MVRLIAAVINLTMATVTSVFGRTGAVTANTGDYDAAEVTNALDKSSTTTQVLQGGIATAGHLTLVSTNPSGPGSLTAGTGVPNALLGANGWWYYRNDTGAIYAKQGGAWSSITGGGGAVSSVFGRTGAVVATGSDYSAVTTMTLKTVSATGYVSTAPKTATTIKTTIVSTNGWHNTTGKTVLVSVGATGPANHANLWGLRVMINTTGTFPAYTTAATTKAFQFPAGITATNDSMGLSFADIAVKPGQYIKAIGKNVGFYSASWISK